MDSGVLISTRLPAEKNLHRGNQSPAGRSRCRVSDRCPGTTQPTPAVQFSTGSFHHDILQCKQFRQTTRQALHRGPRRFRVDSIRVLGLGRRQARRSGPGPAGLHRVVVRQPAIGNRNTRCIWAPGLGCWSQGQFRSRLGLVRHVDIAAMDVPHEHWCRAVQIISYFFFIDSTFERGVPWVRMHY